jgi:hypothetical protein
MSVRRKVAAVLGGMIVAAPLVLAAPAAASQTQCDQQGPWGTQGTRVTLCVTYTLQGDGVGFNVQSHQVKVTGSYLCGAQLPEGDICLDTGYTWIANGSGVEKWNASSPDLTAAECSVGGVGAYCQHTWSYGGDGVIQVNTNTATVGYSGVVHPDGTSAKSVALTVHLSR